MSLLPLALQAQSLGDWVALNKPKLGESLFGDALSAALWVGVEGDTGCILLLPGEASSDAASCAQPCPCSTESWECLLGPGWG